MSCCNSCCNETCVLLNYNTLKQVIYEIDFSIAYMSDKLRAHLAYGHFCEASFKSNMIKLSMFRDTLVRVFDRLVVGGTQCLCDEDIQRVIEQVKDITSFIPCGYIKDDLVVDDTNVISWIAENPMCVSREEWEKLTYYVCNTITMDVSFEKLDTLCNLTFDIVREIIPYSCIVAINVALQACELDWKITRTVDECKLDFKILTEKHDCTLDLDTYMCLVEDHGFTFDIVDHLLTSNLTVTSGTPPCIMTASGNTYNLGDLKTCEIKALVEDDQLGETFKIDFEKINKFKTDYGDN